mmetsp:Transcript_99590/g.280995  ORF Transcript_99590/g.280995 Transcript_99590/m.280995 type:complete len:263 (+) Transcript_99590:607-1395(+)
MRGLRSGPAITSMVPGLLCSVAKEPQRTATTRILRFSRSTAAPTAALAPSDVATRDESTATSPMTSKCLGPVAASASLSSKSKSLSEAALSSSRGAMPLAVASRSASVKRSIFTQFLWCRLLTSSRSHSAWPANCGRPCESVSAISKPSSPQIATITFSSDQPCTPTFLKTLRAAPMRMAAASRSRQQTCKMKGSKRSQTASPRTPSCAPPRPAHTCLAARASAPTKPSARCLEPRGDFTRVRLMPSQALSTGSSERLWRSK